MSQTVPKVRFVIGGVQKGGTTALAQYLAAIPGVALPMGKEAHVFDAPDFDESWCTDEIDARYAGHFVEGCDRARLHGDATPIYVFHPRLVARIARYNPAMRWVILLRDPVARAYSQYCMEHARGDEHWPAWAAFLFERWRLRGHADDFSHGSPLRHYSYRARGDYMRQLRVLYRHFPQSQVLLIDNRALAENPQAVTAQVCRFLGVAADGLEMRLFTRVFEGNYRPLGERPWLARLLRWLMRREVHEAKQILEKLPACAAPE
ncbi:sulfotransferase [Lysobacteraceae bacterium NML08-0793]|nr:sulfotransferase [Xanthomonadaceae bacterium NML08-0793]